MSKTNSNIPANAAAVAVDGTAEDSSNPMDENMTVAIAAIFAAAARQREAVKMIGDIYASVISAGEKTAAGDVDRRIFENSKGISERTRSTGAYLAAQWRSETTPDKTTTAYTKTATYSISNCIAWGIFHLIKDNTMVNALKGPLASAIKNMMTILDEKGNPVLDAQGRPVFGKEHGTMETPSKLEVPYEELYKNLFPMYRCGKVAYGPTEPAAGTAQYCHSGINLNFMWKSANSYFQSLIPIGAICHDIRERMALGLLHPMGGTDMLAAMLYCYYEVILSTYDYYVALSAKIKMDDPNGASGAASAKQVMSKMAFLDAPIAADVPFTWMQMFTFLHAQTGERSRCYIERLRGSNPNKIPKDSSELADIVEKYTGYGGLDASSIMKNPLISDMIGKLNLSSLIPSLGS